MDFNVNQIIVYLLPLSSLDRLLIIYPLQIVPQPLHRHTVWQCAIALKKNYDEVCFHMR